MMFHSSSRSTAEPQNWVLADWKLEGAETVAAIDPPSPHYWRRLLRGRIPVVIRGFASDWKPCRWTFENLAARIGGRSVPLVRLRDGVLGFDKYDGMDYEPHPFDVFARHIAGGETPEFFLQLNPDEHLPELAKELEVPQYSHPASWRDRKLTMAGVGTTTPIHRELPDNLFVLLCGQKEVALFPPSDSHNLYAFGPFSGVPHFSKVDPRQRDPEEFPRVRHTSPFHCRMQSGDALLIPRGWWHAVHTVEPSIAVGNWWAHGAFALLPVAATVYKRVFGLRT